MDAMKDSFRIKAASTGTKAVVAAIGAVVLVAADALRRRNRAQRRAAAAERKKGCEKIRLLPVESSPVVRSTPPMSTVTFFETTTEDDEDVVVEAARSFFESRARAIAEANPWLSGFLDRDDDDGGNLALFVPPPGKISPGRRHFRVLDDLVVPMGDYHRMVEALEPALIGNTEEHVASLGRERESESERDTGTVASWEPLWKVAFVPRIHDDDDDDDDDRRRRRRFALVVSANHSLLDGHGYYRIFRMLSSEEPIAALAPDRNLGLGPAIDAATGSEPSLLAETPIGFVLSFVVAAIRNAIFPRTESIGFVVSDDWIRRRKEAHRADVESIASSSSSGSASSLAPPPPFVSTNDLVVHEFCKRANCDLAFMAINLRGRVEGCGDDLVGNYEHLIAYTAKDRESPASIRRSVTGPVYERIGAAAGGDESDNRLPTSREHMFPGLTYAVMTSWATFAKGDLSVDGGTMMVASKKTTTTKQTLHLPLYDFPKSTPASSFSSMVIFRPRDGETAVMCGGRAELIRQLAASEMVGSILYPPSGGSGR